MPDGMFRATNVGGTGVPVLILSYTWLTLDRNRDSKTTICAENCETPLARKLTGRRLIDRWVIRISDA